MNGAPDRRSDGAAFAASVWRRVARAARRWVGDGFRTSRRAATDPLRAAALLGFDGHTARLQPRALQRSRLVAPLGPVLKPSSYGRSGCAPHRLILVASIRVFDARPCDLPSGAARARRAAGRMPRRRHRRAQPAQAPASAGSRSNAGKTCAVASILGRRLRNPRGKGLSGRTGATHRAVCGSGRFPEASHPCVPQSPFPCGTMPRGKGRAAARIGGAPSPNRPVTPP